MPALAVNVAASLRSWLAGRAGPSASALKDWLVVSLDGDALRFHDFGGYESRHRSWMKLCTDGHQHLLRHRGEHSAARRRQTAQIALFSGDRPTPRVLPRGMPAFFCAESKRSLPTHGFPDWVYGGWPEVGIEDFDRTAEAIEIAGRAPPVASRLFWAGTASHPARERLLNIGAARPDLFDFVRIEWKRDGAGPRLQADGYLSLPEHCQYPALIDVEGNGYSGRVKLLLFSRRPLLLQSRQYWDFGLEALVPWQHFIPVRSDLGDLIAKAEWLRASPKEGRAIAERAWAFAAERLNYSYMVASVSAIFERVTQQ